ncbi:hypothetical protein [Leptospira santarosai]|uniref:hypothetical protein n=1 Tax=Leptospira santarosai TaxID=28183 RepID=UPI0002BF105F|nr:hypothetical protein [Leptospira santarosai]EMO71892.1 hypothetical protein LEP1GSC130_0695 [Leptospira santarosai str. 200403458]EMO98761.1 hypothetical protein LEP1GSC120_1608 [Leptospira santarosai str. 200702252]
MQDLHSHKTRRLCIKTRNNAEVLGRDNKGKSVKNFRNRPGLLIAKIRRRERV